MSARPGTEGAEFRGTMAHLPSRRTPFGSYPRDRSRATILVMQVIASSHAKAGQPSRFRVLTALLVGATLVAASLVLLYLVFGDHFVDRFMPRGRATTSELIAGALAWTFALTAPAGFGLVGIARLVTAFDRYRARRTRVTPALRLRRAIGDDHVVATGVRLPDDNRVVPELVIGPFGAAVIE